jgi:hypothetical protein
MKQPRLFWWIVATLLLLCLIAALAPQQLPVSLYKLSLVTTAGVIGYWLDRSLFPYARPDSLIGLADDADGNACTLDILDDAARSLVFAAAMIRRAFIVAAAMLAMGLGA